MPKTASLRRQQPKLVAQSADPFPNQPAGAQPTSNVNANEGVCFGRGVSAATRSCFSGRLSDVHVRDAHIGHHGMPGLCD